ncbi:hypothetical protein D3C71_1307560 [compost metagenome]
MTPDFAGHPEIVRPVRARFGRIIRSPGLKSRICGILKLLPSVLLHMLGSIAAETVDAELLYPGRQPFHNIIRGSDPQILTESACRRNDPCVVGATFLCPFRLEKRRKTLACRHVGLEVWQTRKRLRQIVAAAGRISGDPRSDPARSPPFSPACRIVIVDVVVEAVPGLSASRDPTAGHPVQPCAVSVLLHILNGRIAGMVHHDIQYDPDAQGMG